MCLLNLKYVWKWQPFIVIPNSKSFKITATMHQQMLLPWNSIFLVLFMSYYLIVQILDVQTASWMLKRDFRSHGVDEDKGLRSKLYKFVLISLFRKIKNFEGMRTAIYIYFFRIAITFLDIHINMYKYCRTLKKSKKAILVLCLKLFSNFNAIF